MEDSIKRYVSAAIHEQQRPGVEGVDPFFSVTDEMLQFADQMPLFPRVFRRLPRRRCRGSDSPVTTLAGEFKNVVSI